MRRWLARGLGGPYNIGGLLVAAELAFDIWGIAGEIMTHLQPIADAAPAVLRLVGLALIVPFAWAVGAFFVQIVRASGPPLLTAFDMLQDNDRWAARQLQAWLPEIEQCVRELASIMPAPYLGLHPALETRVQLLAEALADLGITVTPDDNPGARGWYRRLAKLAVLASHGHIEAARSLDTWPTNG